MQAAATCANFVGGKSPCVNPAHIVSILLAAVCRLVAAVFCFCPRRENSSASQPAPVGNSFNSCDRREAHRRFFGATDLRRFFQFRRQTPWVARPSAGVFVCPGSGLSASLFQIVLGGTRTAACAAALAAVLLFSGCANVGVSIRPPAIAHFEADLDFSAVIAPLSAWLHSKGLPDFSLIPSDSPTALGLTK